MMIPKAWEVVYKFHQLIGLFLVALVAVSLYLIRDNTMKVAFREKHISHSNSNSNCDLFSGTWVYDNQSYPLYKESKCSFIEDSFACQKQGRKDFKYQNWRWQPHQCHLPRFNATTLLEKLRGKKLVYVGDSVNRNQWESMLCLIESALSPFSNKSVIQTGSTHIFHAREYNATIEFYWSPLLVESNCDDPLNHSGIKRAIRVEVIETHAKYWTDADILIFDSYAWWLDPHFTLVWGSFGSSDTTYKKVMMQLRLYEMSLRTWSDWLELNVNKTRTKLFFMGLSPVHSSSTLWGGTQGNCLGETEPIVHEEVRWNILLNRRLMKVVESVIGELDARGVKVQYMNTSGISGYRKEAHPSIYGSYPNPKRYRSRTASAWNSDCLHWCLPGVPDIWNQILYAYILDFYD